MKCSTISFVVALTSNVLYAQVDVLTAQYNLNRTSSNMQETTLTRANVNSAQFGKLFTRTVDAPFYASPLIVTNFNVPGVGYRNLVYIATLGNSVFAFDADDPTANAPYWSVTLGNPMPQICCFLGPSIGILSTPVIDRSTNTIYVTAIIYSGDVGLYLFALDLGTGALKFNSPQRITYTFPSGVTKTDATPWLQRAALLVYNNVLYVGTSNVWEIDNDIKSQEGFIQTFQADDLSVKLASFETTPTSQGGAFWQAGRGIAVDSSGDVFVAVDSGDYNPLNSFGDSVIKFSPGTLSPVDWFAPADWSFLYGNNLDETANGVTLIPGTSLAFTGGKVGVIYLLDQNHLGGLEPGTGNAPVQQFQATQGCGTTDCAQHLPTAFWPHATNPYLYVWDVHDYLRAYPFDLTSQLFLTGGATVGTLLPSRAGGMTISSNDSTDGTGIVWATTATQDPLFTAVPGTLRAYNAEDITQELYDSDQNSSRDAMGTFVKMSTPIVANGKVYVNTQSNLLPVYGLLPNTGTIPVTIGVSVNGPTVTVDGGAPFTGTQEFDWTPGSTHTLATSSTQSGVAGTQFVWQSWSDGLALTHTVTASTSTSNYTANFKIQYLLTTQVSPAGDGSISPGAGFFDSNSSVSVIATANAGYTFTGFTGALTGTANSSSVTMSGPLTVTANFQSVGGPASFITGFALSNPPLRNNFTGWVGMKFTVGANAISVSSLGRVCVAGNSGTHTIKLVNASNGTDVPGGSLALSMAGCSAGQFWYGQPAGAITLPANGVYYLVSLEASGGDQWYDYGGVSSTNAATVNNSVYSFGGSSWIAVSMANTSYVPPNFIYTLLQPGPPDLTISKTHSGSFTQGQTGATYSISVTNSGGSPTSGTVSVTDTTPSGLTATNITGSGWSCTEPAGPCTRSDPLNPGASYLPLTVTVTVATNGAASVTNTATVSGGGESNTSNDTANDLTTIQVPLAGTAFVTGYALGGPALRNDFTGWVGMQFTVGANSLTVSALGRVCIVGNAGTHTVKFVNAANRTDVPGGSASLNLGGCVAGQFFYAALAGPITLQPNTAYYLVSQEASGGDQWYDHGGVTTANDAAVNNSLYSFDGANWIAASTYNTSYVPPNFLYSLVAPVTISVNLQANPGGASFAVDGTTYSAPQAFNWTAGSSHTVSATSPQSAGAGVQYVWNNWSDGGAVSHTIDPASATTLTANFTTQYLLTAGGSPSSGGEITLNPTSTSGYFLSGTSVQLTPAPNPGCTFTSWSGDIMGSAIPQTITMSAPHTVTANFQCSGPAATNFLTGYALNGPALRNNFSGFVGMELAVGSQPLSVSAVGRVCISGNSGIHTVKLVAPSTGGVDVPGGSAAVNLNGCTPGQFVYASLNSSITLQAGATYYLVSQEISGGDQWYDHGAVSTTAGAGVINSVYQNGGSWVAAGGPSTSYVPPNFQYTVLSNSAAPLVTSYNLNNASLRNDFSGWVGMKLTVGATQVTVSSLGRVCVAGNSQNHTVEIVNAGTGSVSGSVTVNMAGCASGQFSYATLPSQITLSANTAYYLASQESSGGDQWYNLASLTTISFAAINSAVYSYDGANWLAVGGANTSYVPPNFQ